MEKPTAAQGSVVERWTAIKAWTLISRAGQLQVQRAQNPDQGAMALLVRRVLDIIAR